MKYLFFISFSLLALTLSGQTDQLDEVTKLIETFKAEKDNSLIEKAQGLITDYFEDTRAHTQVQALHSKAKVQSLALENLKQDNPMELCDEIKATYTAALENDKNMEHRNAILSDLYFSKIGMVNVGNKLYEEKNYEEAYQYYVKSLELNDLEIAHPKYVTRDVSIYYTSAVFADLAGHKKEAVKIWEELVGMEYPRPDMYDSLIRYYDENEMESDVKRITTLKAERFPE